MTPSPRDVPREPVFWHWSPDAQRLCHKTQEDAINEYLATLPEGSPLPETVLLQGYARMRVTRRECGDPLAQVLERLDEEYADPENDTDGATPAMRAAEAAFLAVVVAEYTSWACEKVTEVTVSLEKYRQETREIP